MKYKVLHLSHVGPLAIPNGGVLHIKESITLERNLGIDSIWMSFRLNVEDGYMKHKDHLRVSPIYASAEHMFGDWNLAFEIASHPDCQRKLIETLEKYEDYILVFEGPWMWPLYRTISRHLKIKPFKIIYSCHNLEYLILKKIYSSRGWHGEKLEIASFSLFAMERDLIRNADAVIALSDYEFYKLKELAAKQVIRASNGASTPLKSNLPPLRESESRVKNLLFVSSNWDPHVSGLNRFFENLNNSNFTCNLRIVGSIIDSFTNRINSRGILRLTNNRSTIKFLGRISQKRLQKVYATSFAIVLPIDYGGGKGIKSSEALLTGKPVFGTQSAFRGFSHFNFAENVFISQTSENLVNLLIDNLDKTEYIDPYRNSDYRTLTWEYSLNPWLIYLLKLQNSK